MKRPLKNPRACDDQANTASWVFSYHSSASRSPARLTHPTHIGSFGTASDRFGLLTENGWIPCASAYAFASAMRWCGQFDPPNAPIRPADRSSFSASTMGPTGAFGSSLCRR